MTSTVSTSTLITKKTNPRVGEKFFMYQRARRRIIEEGEAAPPQIPPSWPQQAFPEVVKREPAGSSAESQAGESRVAESPGRPMVEIQGVYIISVAARILEMHPQTLRKYERLGLINPERTGGMLRLYSREDIRKILLIRYLMDNLGLNLAGVEFALNLVENLVELERRLASAVADPSLRETIEQEVSRLYRRLNLPV